MDEDNTPSFMNNQALEMDQQALGSCLCGQVEFLVKGPFTGFHYCHCSRCRKSSGAAYAANIFAKPENLQWLSGENNIKRFDLPGSHGYARSFCNNCGCALPYDFGNKGKLLLIPAGLLSNDPEIRPADNIYWKDKADWYTDAASLPCFDGYCE
jgi:hypothetical protein